MIFMSQSGLLDPSRAAAWDAWYLEHLDVMASVPGVGVVGLMIWFVSTRVDLEQEGAVGVGVSPGFFARQVRRKAEMSHAERAAFRDEKSLEAQSIRFFKHFGIALTLIGAGGFLYFQL